MPPTQPPRVRYLLYLLYAVAALALVRMAFVVPGQLQELWLLRNGVVAYEGEPIPLAGDARLEGQLVESWTGRRLADVGVEVVRFPAGEAPPAAGEVWAPSAASRIRSGPDGDFGLDVAPGFYRLRVEDPAYYSSDGYQAVVGDGGQTPAPLVIAAHAVCSLEVELLDADGGPVPGAEVFIKNGDPGRAFFTPQRNGMATTDSHGVAHWRRRCGEASLRRVELPDHTVHYVEQPIELVGETPRLTLAVAQVRAAPPRPRDPVLERRPEGDPGKMLAYTASPSEGAPDMPGVTRLSARIVDEAGAPLRAQVLVDAMAPPAGFRYDYLRFLPIWPVTGPDGSLALEIPTGRLRLLVLPAGGAPLVGEPFDAVAGEALDLGDLTVPSSPGRTLRGRVEGPAGPVAGAEVYPVAVGELGRLFFSAMNTGPFPRTVSGPDGEFELGGLPADTVVVMAYHRDVGAGVPFTLAAGVDDGIDAVLSLRPGTSDVKSGWLQGAYFSLSRDGLLLGRLVEGSAAHRAGLRVGDRPLEIDGIDARWFDPQRAFTVLDGGAGARATTILVSRKGEPEPVEIAWAAAFELPLPDGSERR
jgi:hypothetical protein